MNKAGFNEDFWSEAKKEWMEDKDARDRNARDRNARYARYSKEFKGLSCRAFNCFYLHRQRKKVFCEWKSAEDYSQTEESNEYDTVEKVKSAIVSGKLHPNKSSHPRNYGWRTHTEVCTFVGLDDPLKDKKRKRLESIEKEAQKLRRELT
jgi:hypothetical protein